jgi:hypothetical protein
MASSIVWMQAAALHAFAVSEGTGDFEDYRRVCQSMIDRFSASDDPAILERTIKSCNILSSAVTIDRASVEKVVAALESGSIDAKDTSWYQNVLALDAYRRGQIVGAQELAGKAYGNATVDMHRLMAKTISSLALAASGERQQATLALNVAEAELANRLKRDANGSIIEVSVYRSRYLESGDLEHDLLIAELLIREASTALGK